MKMNSFQKRIFYAEKLYGENALSNIGGVLSFDEQHFIETEELEKIVTEIINKTPSVRLRMNEAQELYEYKYENYHPEIVTLDTDKEGVLGYARKDMEIPFEGSCDTALFDVKIIKYNTGNAIYFKLHHMLGDSISIRVLAQNVEAGYFALQNNESMKIESRLPVYSELSSKKKAAAREYFASKLDGFSPVRFAEKESMETEAGEMKFETKLYHKAMTQAFISSLYLYLSQLLDTRKLSIGFVLANRRLREMNMVGMYANTLPLVMDYAGDSFAELSEMITADVIKLVRYSSYIPTEYLKKDPYEISLSYRYEGLLPETKLGEAIELFSYQLDVPLRISAEEKGDRLYFSIFYRKDLFEDEFIRNTGNAIISILNQQMSGVENLSQVDILTDEDKRRYFEFNFSNDKTPEYISIMEGLADLSTKRKDETVLLWDGGEFTGGKLYEKVTGFASYISNVSGDRIGIDIPRSPEMMVAVLGTLMAGKGFLILSDANPGARAFADVIVDKVTVEQATLKNATVNKAAGNAEKADLCTPEEKIAYMICTSGSTGEPKLIGISRDSITRRMNWQGRQFGFKGNVLQKTVNTFDVSVWEMLSILFGARLSLLSPGDERLPDKVADMMRKYDIEKVHFVPTMLERFLDYIEKKDITFPRLKEIYVSGEKLEKYQAEKHFKLLPKVRLINLYGPAECTIDVTFHEVKREDILEESIHDIPIGKPVDDIEILILNSSPRLLPAGVKGEICISGGLVGEGYISGPAGSSGEKVAAGYQLIGDKKIYRTGDMGKIGFDGKLYIDGRMDDQIKLRGMRLNLSGIKEVILGCNGVNSAEVIGRNNRLECYLTGDFDIEEIKGRVAKEVSVYAVPSIFRKVDEIPVSVNQKTDIKALLKMAEQLDDSDRIKENYIKETQLPEKGAMNDTMKCILTQVRKYVKVGLDDNIFAAGLDSISVIDIACSLQDKGYDISFGDFYENLTVRRIAENLQNKKYYTYLKKQGSKRVMICFPFAGGEPQNYLKMAENLDMDVIGIYVSAFPENCSVKKMAAFLAKKINLYEYEEIFVFGQCVGSVMAMEYAARLKRSVDKLILVTPSVRLDKNTKRPGVSPWRLMNDGVIKLFLKAAGARRKFTKEIIRRFRVDTDRFFNYTGEAKLSEYLHRPGNTGKIKGVDIIYGSRDIFTMNHMSLSSKIEQITGKPADIYIIEGARHFLNEENTEELMLILKSDARLL